MGRKVRRRDHRYHSDDDKEENEEDYQRRNDDDEKTKEVIFKDLDFVQRRELKRHQAKEKRKGKQTCYTCGKTGHVRRECPGIPDDGRGMSRYKGKSSNPKLEKQKYRARKYGEGEEHYLTPSECIEYPSDFEFEEKEEDWYYYDVGCDILATMNHLRSGRGKHKISQKEALEEYQKALDHASYLGGMISRTTLEKLNRPWIDPSLTIFTSEKEEITTTIYYVLGLGNKIAVGTTDEQAVAVQSLIDTTQAHPKKILGIFGSLDYSRIDDDKLSEQDQESECSRLRCCFEAAGRSEVLLQIKISPGLSSSSSSGAASQDHSSNNIVGTKYAKVLLDLHTITSEMIAKYPQICIQLSSWMGKSDHMLALIQAFPRNIKAIGIDGSVSFTKAVHLHECAFEIPLDKLVLETSQIIPSNVANELGRDASFHSGWWPFVAQAIALHKKIPITTVARAVTKNTLQLYPQLVVPKMDKTTHELES